MENTTELRLAWRQEFASALLDELECVHSDSHIEVITDFCDEHTYSVEPLVDMRTVEFALMSFIVKRKLRRKGLKAVMDYLEMLEDCFTDCKMCIN